MVRPLSYIRAYLVIFLSILLILLIPVSFFVLSQEKKDRIEREEQYMLNQMQQAKIIFEIIEQNMLEIREISYQIYNDQDFAESLKLYTFDLETSSFVQPNLFQRIKLNQRIDSYASRLLYITDILILTKNTNHIITSKGWFSKTEYEKTYPTMPENLVQALNVPLRLPIEIVSISEDHNNIILANSLYGINSDFIVCIVINRNMMGEIFDRIHNDVFRSKAILLNGVLIYGDDSQTAWDYKLHSFTTNIDYQAAFFELTHDSWMSNNIIDFIYIFVACAIISLFVSILFFNPLIRIYIRLKQVFNSVEFNKTQYRITNPMSKYENILNELHNNYIKALNKINQYRNILNESDVMLTILLDDHANDYLNMITEVWPWFNLNGPHAVAIGNVNVSDKTKIKELSVHLEETLSRLSMNHYFRYHFIKVVTNDIAIILSFYSETPSDTYAYVKDCIHSLDDFAFSFGSIGKGVLGLQTSYYQARQHQLTNKPQMDEVAFYYPIKIELQLVSCLKSANMKQCQSLLEHVYSQNAQQSISEQQLGKLNQVIFETLERYAKEYDFDITAYTNHFNDTNIADLDLSRNLIYETCNALSDYLVQVKQKEPDDLMLKLYNYILDNYTDPEISVSSLSNHYKISRNRLSALFKSISELSIPDLINRLRVEKAVELMQTNQYTLVHISQLVGFTSYLTFQRAFIKNMNIKPSEYQSI